MTTPDPMPEHPESPPPSDSSSAIAGLRSAISRRALFRTGGALSLGMIIAACGQTGGGSAPGRVGGAPAPDTLPTDKMTVNDAVLLRTLASLEHTMLDFYERGAEMAGDQIDPKHRAAFDLFDRFISDHQANAETLNRLATREGGQPFECANPWYAERLIPPIEHAIAGGGPDDLAPSDDPQRDVIIAVWALESVLGASAQQLLPIFTKSSLRPPTIAIGNNAVRHAAAVAIAATGSPAGYASPAVYSDEAEADPAQVSPPHAITSQWGLLSGVPLTIGAEGAGSIRVALTLSTPAENSYVYGYISCNA